MEGAKLWFQANMDVVFFVYGLSFVFMGLAILFQPKDDSSQFRLGGILWLLAWFGLIHGANECLDMWAIIKGRSRALDLIRLSFLVVSYLFIFEFGRRFFAVVREERGFWTQIKTSAWWITPLIVCLVLAVSVFSGDFWMAGGVWTRHLFGFPGAFLSGLCFILYYRSNRETPKPLGTGLSFYLSGTFLIAYSILGGLVAPKLNLFTSEWLPTNESFLSATGLPVQFSRAGIALVVGWCIIGILRIFDWENKNRLATALRKTEVLNDELETLVEERTRELKEAYSKLQESEQKIIQSAKLVSLGEMGAGIAHELNSPLAGILSITEVLLKRLSKDDPNYFLLEKARDAAVRSKYIILDMLTYARPFKGKAEPFCVNLAIKATLSLFISEFKACSLEISTAFDPELPKVVGNKGQLMEVFLNILKNAKDAMEGIGKIHITTKTEMGEGGTLTLIEIRDTGPGIPTTSIDRIFDPFFTTKTKGGGVNIGLGLSIAHSIVKECCGSIEARNIPGGGALFRISLPAAFEGGM